MNINSMIDSVLTEGKNLDIQRHQLYVDLTHKLTSIMKKKKPSEEEIVQVISSFHSDYYQDLPIKEVAKIKEKFTEDALTNEFFDIAVSSTEDFIKHLAEKDE